MGFDDPFLVHLVIVSPLNEYGNLVSSYNNMKDKWTVDELILYAVLDEERLKKTKSDVNQVGCKRRFNGKWDNNAKKNKQHFSNQKFEKGESSYSNQPSKSTNDYICRRRE